MSDDGLTRIAKERARQIKDEGWSAGHDDDHRRCELAKAAACYAASAAGETEIFSKGFYEIWPWAKSYDKRDKHSNLRQLEIAGALIVAEIDRLLRITEDTVDVRSMRGLEE